jgi:CHAT domain-containing protein
VVLAACEAAADVTYSGDEVLGFVSALLARGTAGLAASTVVVPDAAALPLMMSLHEHLLRGDTLALALHAARSTLDRDDPADYVNWCGFTAFGAA